MHTPFPPTIFTTKNKRSRTSAMVVADDDDASGDSLATPRPFEDGTTTTPSGIQRETLAEQRYAAEGRTLKALAVLSL